MISLDDLRLKAGLLIHGVDFSAPGVLDWLYEENKVRPGNGLYNYNKGVNNRGGLIVLGQSNIRAPNEILWNFSSTISMRAEVRSNPASPFKIILDDDCYLLQEGKSTIKVAFPSQQPFNFELTRYGTRIGEVVHVMGENALRVYPDMTCLMDKPGIKCRFCGPLPARRRVSDEEMQEEIFEAIRKAQENMPVDHIFMSSGAFYSSKKTAFYAAVIRNIKSALHNTHAEILFSLVPPPPTKKGQIAQLVEAGLTDVSFNLEVWDDCRWDIKNPLHIGEFKVRSGKQNYFSAFETVVKMLGRGSAKSNFIGGLEDHETFFEGAEYLLEKGVVPSLTVYYPTPGSEWFTRGIDPRVQSFHEDPVEYILHLYLGLAERIHKVGLKPHWSQRNRISGLEQDAFAYVVGDDNVSSRVEDRMRKNGSA